MRTFKTVLMVAAAAAIAMPATANIGTKSNFTINNPFTYTGYTEMLTQFSDAFNAQSGGCLTLTSANKRGEIETSTFFQNIANLVQRRDPSSTAAATDQSVPMATIDKVKLERKVGPVAHTYDSFRKIGVAGNVPENHDMSGIDLLDFVVGQQTAKAQQVEMINTVLKAVVTAHRQVAALNHKDTAGKLGTLDLVDGLSKMGDAAANNVRLWVMHSAEFYALVKDQITANIDGVTGFVVAEASPITLNRPVLVIDSPALVIADGVSAGTSSYITLGLGAQTGTAENTEDMMLATQLITGLENLSVRIQGEYSYSIGVRGFTWDTTNGGVNPADAAIGTATNWDKKFADIKDLGAVVIETA